MSNETNAVMKKITNKAGTKTFYTEGQEVSKITTASGTGVAQIDNLPLGNYLVKETKAPIGYLLNTNTYNVNFEGYKYYVPAGMSFQNKEEYNAILRDN